jgi:ribosomal protein L12E/L44/L45/RPP1/RPP2
VRDVPLQERVSCVTKGGAGGPHASGRDARERARERASERESEREREKEKERERERLSRVRAR